MTGTEALQLSLAFQGADGSAGQNVKRLVPEECAYFDVALHNSGASAMKAYDLDNNMDSPVYTLYNSAGGQIQSVTHETMTERMTGGGMGEPMDVPPSLVTVPPGGSKASFLDLWNYMTPPGKGLYGLGARDRTADGAWIESNRLRFEIVDAQVKDVAFGYEDVMRGSSLLLWVAIPEGGGAPLLLARLSTLDIHRVAQWSGNPLGTVDAAARLAIAGKPIEGTPNDVGWFAVVEHGQAELIHHFRTSPQWRSPKIALPAADFRPVPGFPDREHAVFLATGSGPHGAALAGVKTLEDEKMGNAWSVPLEAAPRFAVCAFRKTGPIALLLVSYGNGQTRLSRMDVDEDGKVAAAQHMARTTSNHVLALAVDQRPGQPQAFVAVEQDPNEADRLFVTRVPLQGEVQVREIPHQTGWPVRQGRPAQTHTAELQIAWDGRPILAMSDETGRYYAGSLQEGSLMEVGGAANGAQAIGLHIAALKRQIAFGAFTAAGKLEFLGGLR